MALADMSIAALALTYFGKTNAVTATALVWPESGGNPNAKNPSGATGLWQVKGPPTHPWATGDLTDPQYNAQAAARVFKEEGWRAWAVYNSGAYTLYLSRAKKAVDANLKENPDGPWISDITTQKPNPLSGVSMPDWLKPILAPITAVGNALQFLSDPANWLRLATFVAGGFVILLGVLFLIGSNKGVQKAASFVPAGRVVKVARRVAA